MNRTNYKLIGLWVLHLFCMLLLAGVMGTMFRYASSDYFMNAMHNDSFQETDNFERIYSKDVEQTLDYIELKSEFETNGQLDLNKVVQTSTDAYDNQIEYTLQDAIDYGKSVGIYFNNERRLVVNPNGKGAGSSDRFTEEEVIDGEYSFGEYENIVENSLGKNSVSNNNRLFLLYRLSEYYEYERQLGIAEGTNSNYLFRLVYVNSQGDTLIASNTDEHLENESLHDYGTYYWYDSKKNMLDTNTKGYLHGNVLQKVDENEFFQDNVFELMAVVDTDFSAEDTYAIAAQKYDAYKEMIRLMLILGCMLILGMIISLISVLFQSMENESRFSGWYTESIFLILFLMIVVMYWGSREVLFAFQSRHVMDLVAGIALMVLGYLPISLCVINIICRIQRKEMTSGMISVHLMQYVEQNVQLRAKSRNSMRPLFYRMGFQVFNIVLMLMTLQCVLHMRYGWSYVLFVAVILWNVIYFCIGCRKENQQRKIFERIEQMTEGSIGEKLDVSAMDPDNRVLGNMVNALDDSLEKAVQTRTKSERMQTELIANVSHDLRTPLTSILNYVDLLRREPLPEGRSREYLKVLEDKANRLRSLAEALMEASRATSGTLNIEWVDIDMVQMLNQVTGEFFDRFEMQNLEPVIHMISPPAMVRADGKILWRIFENLFTNVCKYAMPGTKVYIDLQETSQSLVFTMKNISSRKLTQSAEELTERFIRGDEARTTEGTGLGLSIVKSMTEQLHGRFELFLDGEYFRARLIFPKAE